MPYPKAIDSAVAKWLDTYGQGTMREATGTIARRYRQGHNSAAVDVAAYLTSRAPATYAAVSRVLREASFDTAPFSLLDVGAGPGTATWAALERWPEIGCIQLVDNDARFLTAAAAIAESAGLDFTCTQTPLQNLDTQPAALVLASYVLAELDAAAMASVATLLWRHTAETLVIIEPGTPRGFERIRAVRTALIRAGAFVVAPCPHDVACPMIGNDWCHFSVRLARSRAHMHAKGAVVPFEDEPFSYLIVSRRPAANRRSRILRPPVETKFSLDLSLCAHDGLQQMQVASRDKVRFKRMRKLGWGDRLEE
jgi:ribosomal protein RSM22 (predicted rRNA methylase)